MVVIVAILPKREAEAHPHLNRRLPLRPLPSEGVGTRLGGEFAANANRRVRVLHHPQLRQPGKVVLKQNRLENESREGQKRGSGAGKKCDTKYVPLALAFGKGQ